MARASLTGALLSTGAQHLVEAFGSDHPARLESELLLGHVVGCDLTQLHTHPEQPVTDENQQRFLALIEERKRGQPIAYLIGEWEFYSLAMHVDSRVLVPRPETELLVDYVRRQLESGQRILDIGTGSGCIAVAIAHEAKALEVTVSVTATDISKDALEVAARNVRRHGVDVELLWGDLVARAAGQFDVIVSNPPYVRADDPALEASVAAFEPALALRDCHDGDGLGFYRRFTDEVVPRLTTNGVLVLEVGEDQAQRVCELFAAHDFEAETIPDLAGIERVVVLKRSTARL